MTRWQEIEFSPYLVCPICGHIRHSEEIGSVCLRCASGYYQRGGIGCSDSAYDTDTSTSTTTSTATNYKSSDDYYRVK